MIFLIDIIDNFLTKYSFVSQSQTDTQTVSHVTECNYQDNYYGDQLCMLIKK